MNERFINKYLCEGCDIDFCSETQYREAIAYCPQCHNDIEPYEIYETRYRGKYAVAIYEIDRAYGGPEEGGWWYDCGNLERIVAVTKNPEKANRMARRMNDRFRHLNRKHHISVSSVAYSGGSYEADVCEIDGRKTVPLFYPETRPHYE